MKMIDHNHFICHLILGTFTEYPFYKKIRFKLPRFTATGNLKRISSIGIFTYFLSIKFLKGVGYGVSNSIRSPVTG